MQTRKFTFLKSRVRLVARVDFLRNVALLLFFIIGVARLSLAFPPVQFVEISPAPSLPMALHHGLLFKIKPITDPNLLYFKLEVSGDDGTHWFLYQDGLRPFDHRHIIVPYRTRHYGLATGTPYLFKLCAHYGEEIQCALSPPFQLPTVVDQTRSGSLDSDDDILTAEKEYNLGTDPRNPDSDNDQMADPFEVSRNLDPNFTQRPVISLSENFLDFGRGSPFGLSPTQHRLFTITNTGQRVLRISNGIVSGGGASHFKYFNQHLEVQEILPHQSRTLAIDFLPKALGSFTASLDILSDDIAHFPLSISLSGVGSRVAKLSIESDAPLAFENTTVGEDSPEKTLRVSNPESDSPLDVSIFTKQTLNFLVIPNRVTLPSGGEENLRVVFTPEWAGSYEGLLEIRVGNSVGPHFHQIALRGLARGPTPRMRPLVSTINFGSVRIREETKRDLIIFNDGEGVLTIKKIDFGRDANGPPNAFRTSSENLVVPPMGSNRVEITFKPSLAQDYTSQLCLVTNESLPLTTLSACRLLRPIGQGLFFPEAQGGIALTGRGQ